MSPSETSPQWSSEELHSLVHWASGLGTECGVLVGKMEQRLLAAVE